MGNEVESTILKLLAYCRANDWAGYDPYDALNSKVFGFLPLLNCRIPRIVLTQVLRRSPINFRRLLLVPKMQNPKALALFIAGFLKLAEIELGNQEGLIQAMVDRLIALRSPGTAYWCWGYSFPWQGRTVLVPAGAPNLVCTSFVGDALLDVYEHRHDLGCLRMAVSAAEYTLNELYWSDGSVVSFSYPQPSVRSQTHNANFLAAAFLCRVYRCTGERKFLDPALKVARCSAAKQHADGSWHYGEAPSQRWVDSFHSGYNLCALRSICWDTKTSEFDSCIRRGFDFYRAHFVREDGAPRYFHDRTYPIDIHCAAQTIITLLAFRDLDPDNIQLAHSVFRWAMTHMWDERGFFYYRVLRRYTIRTSYMRWSQAWMLLAISMLLRESDTLSKHPLTQSSPVLA